MKLPSDSRVPTPYLPIVNAIAPNAPIGASFMIKPTMRKKMWLTMSMRRSTGSPCEPKCLQAEGEQDREEQDLEDFTGRKGTNNRRWNDLHQEPDGTLVLRLRGVGCN